MLAAPHTEYQKITVETPLIITNGLSYTRLDQEVLPIKKCTVNEGDFSTQLEKVNFEGNKHPFLKFEDKSKYSRLRYTPNFTLMENKYGKYYLSEMKGEFELDLYKSEIKKDSLNTKLDGEIPFVELCIMDYYNGGMIERALDVSNKTEIEKKKIIESELDDIYSNMYAKIYKNEKFIKLANSFKSSIDQCQNDKDKALILFNWISDNIKYTKDNSDIFNSIEDGNYKLSLERTLDFKRGNCMEQSTLFDALARYYNLNTAIVAGRIKPDKKVGHAWNTIQDRATQKTYNIDCSLLIFSIEGHKEFSKDHFFWDGEKEEYVPVI